MWTTFIHPDNPFFGGMDKLLYQLFFIALILFIIFIIVLGFAINAILTAIFGKGKEDAQSEDNNVESEETSDCKVVENSAQSVNDEKESDNR